MKNLTYCDRGEKSKTNRKLLLFPMSLVLLVISWPFFSIIWSLNITEKSVYCTICHPGLQELLF